MSQTHVLLAVAVTVALINFSGAFFTWKRRAKRHAEPRHAVANLFHQENLK
jgi:hypothetical protein